jgi:poly-gamma-glutamate synthesis protein (capsule biosynthesis protein)
MCSLKVAAVGDISFEGRNALMPEAKAFSAIAPYLKESDIVIGNLENPLIDDGASIPGKCTLHGHTGWAGVLKKSGFTALSLANNHLMDYGPSGIASTMLALKNAGIAFVGAGMNETEALAPLIVEANKRSVAILARSSVEVASQCYAKGLQAGVAFFNLAQTIGAAKALKSEVDYVILVIHWGLEQYEYPTPKQKKEAAALLEAGVDCIIGHHPHVLQGYETVKGKPVFYSLGNFLFDDFDWEYRSAEGSTVQSHIILSEMNRTGAILRLEASKGSIKLDELLVTATVGSVVEIKQDNTRDEKRIVRISKRLSIPMYGYCWKVYSIWKEFELRVAKQIPLGKVLKNFHKIRPSHFKRLFGTILKSAKIVSGKTTNPYD